MATGEQQIGVPVERGTPPGPSGNILLGNLLDMRSEGPLAFYQRLWQKYGDTFQHRLVNIPITFFIHPDDVEYILKTNKDNFDKGTIVDVRAARVLGESLFISQGEVWRDMRFLMDPPFTHEGVAEFFWNMAGATDMMLERWQQVASNGDTIEMADEMMRFTFSMISRSIFSEDLSEEGAEARPAIVFLLKYVQDLVLQPVLVPASVPTPANRRYHDAMRQITALVQRHIDDRRNSGEMKADLISHFLTGTDPHGRHLTDTQVRDQVLTTFVAGQENSALALAWFWYLLARHPEAEERVHAELDQVLSGRPATAEDIQNLHFTRRAFEETIRLYPVLWVMPRIVQEDDVIGGYSMPAGSTIVINSFLTHRHPEFWDRPDEFDPDRFLPERVEGLPRYAYIPFGGGLRKCIGNKFAMLASMQFIATVAQRYRVVMAHDEPVEPVAVSTIRPKGGMPMRLIPRS